jgi:SSS family solute:Na+ symporter
MLQVVPAVVFGLYTRWFRANALLAGWAVGMALGTGLSWVQGWTEGIKTTYPLPYIGVIYIGVIALVANALLATLITIIANLLALARSNDATVPADYEDA